MLNLSPVEIRIVKLIRQLNPYEKIEIIKDQNGKPNSFIVHRSQKVVLNLKNVVQNLTHDD